MPAGCSTPQELCEISFSSKITHKCSLLGLHVSSVVKALSFPLSLSLPPSPLQRLYELGGEVADSAQKCTHLVASKVTRTVKFLTAISVVKHIVTPEWLQESWKSQKFVGEWWVRKLMWWAGIVLCYYLKNSLAKRQGQSFLLLQK